MLHVSSEMKSTPSSSIGVKRERSPSENMPATPTSPDVYNTLSLRIGGQPPLFSFTDNEDKTTPKTAVSIADVIPYMWKEKPLEATLKKLIADLQTAHPLSDSLIAQVNQLTRMFLVMWNDCVFSGLSAEETLSKVSLDPQAWLIAEAAMEVILQAKYTTQTLEEVQAALRKFKSMVPHHLLLNPDTGRREWERVAYLTETYLVNCEAKLSANKELTNMHSSMYRLQLEVAAQKQMRDDDAANSRAEKQDLLEVLQQKNETIVALKQHIKKLSADSASYSRAFGSLRR